MYFLRLLTRKKTNNFFGPSQEGIQYGKKIKDRINSIKGGILKTFENSMNGINRMKINASKALKSNFSSIKYNIGETFKKSSYFVENIFDYLKNSRYSYKNGFNLGSSRINVNFTQKGIFTGPFFSG